MKIKILGLFVCTLLITTILPLFLNFQAEEKEWTNQNDENSNEIQNSFLYDVSPVSTESNVKIVKDDSCDCNTDLFPFAMIGNYKDSEDSIYCQKPTPLDTPEYFNWADLNGEDWTTPVRDQGYCGSCWCFAAVALIESTINIQENNSELDLDLSEQYVISCLPRAGSCRGGLETNALKYIIDTSVYGNYCNGIIPESYMRYQADDTIPCEEKCPDWEDKLIPLVNYSRWNAEPEDRNRIKTQIFQTGPIATSLHVNRDFLQWHITSHDPTDYFPFQEKHDTNHVVLMVGWKDDPNIGNGGYWICKNSWGTGYGYNGFFNIEYGSLHVDDSDVVSVVYDPESFNFEPVGKANGIYSAGVDEEITFDSVGSFDAEGVITSYHWNLGDGTEKEGASVKHIYSEKGIYPVTLTVTDKDGKIGVDTTWAFIDTTNNPPDKPTIDGPIRVANLTWENYTFSTNDPEMDDIYYYIDWDEGEVDEWLGPYKSGEEVTFKHYWVFRNKYTLRVKAKDIYGYESDWATHKITIPYSYNTPTVFFWEQLFQRFPNAFPILRYLAGY